MADLNLNKDRFEHFTDHLAEAIQARTGEAITPEQVKDVIKTAIENHRTRKDDAHMDGMDLTLLSGQVITGIVNKMGANPETLQKVMAVVNEGIKNYCEKAK